MALIELEHVSRHYAVGDGQVVRALDDVSLRIEAGEMLAIMGPSGSGKSTLMNLLGCLDKPSSGRLAVDGQDVDTLGADETAALRRETFGFIFQRYHLLSHLDAVANVELPAVYAGLDGARRRRRAAELLRRLGLGERLDHRPNALSGGQQQRVSVARALMNGGRIILADEPTGALDSASGAELLAMLEQLNAQGHTVILVTHDATVAAHARRIVEMRDGRVVRDEPVAAQAAARPAPAEPALPQAELTSSPSVAGQWREALAVSLAVLAGNRLRAALSMVGIGIGIAAVVGVMALGEGLQTTLRKSLDAMGSPAIDAMQGNPRLNPGTAARPFTARDAAALRSVPGVAAARLQRNTFLTARHAGLNAQVQVSSTGLGDLARAREVLVEGRDIGALDLETAAPVVLLNQRARETLFRPGHAVLGERVMVGELALTVIGVTEAGSAAPGYFSAATLYVPDTTFGAKIDTGGEAVQMRIYPEPGYATELLLEPLRERLRSLHGDAEDFTLTDSRLFERATQTLLGGAESVLTAIAAISLLVGGVGVMNIMLVSVAERTREIGIRMAIGARPSDVRRQFLIESVVICALGALAGLALPWAAALFTRLTQSEVELVVGWRAIVLALGTSTAIGLLFGNLPADRAARLNPVTALARD
jgi:macrolide transport system ATP-binding/permease protein